MDLNVKKNAPVEWKIVCTLCGRAFIHNNMPRITNITLIAHKHTPKLPTASISFYTVYRTAVAQTSHARTPMFRVERVRISLCRTTLKHAPHSHTFTLERHSKQDKKKTNAERNKKLQCLTIAVCLLGNAIDLIQNTK